MSSVPELDLKITKAEKLFPDEIYSLFTPSIEFDKIIERDTTLLIGPKGAGKSMILNYLSFPVQIERFKSKNLNKFDESNFGVYLRCNEHHFGNEKEVLDEFGNPKELWQKRFIHLFNLTVCEILVGNLQTTKEYPLIKITDDEEKEFCKEIKEIFNLQCSLNFRELRSAINSEIRAVRKTNLSHIDVYTCTTKSNLSELQTILQNTVDDFKHKMIVVLLDEYHELSEEQQKIISEIISVRKPIFKIASLPLGLTDTRQTKGKYLDLTQDFQFVNIGTRNVTKDTSELPELKKFFTLMANKRLEIFNLKIEDLLDGDKSTKSDEKPDYAGLNNFVILSAGNAKTFLDLLNLTISQWKRDTAFIPRYIQQNAVKQFAREQMDGIDFIPAISVYKFRSLILKIGLLFQNYLKLTKRPYLQIGIKDPENLSSDTIEILSVATKRSYLMSPANERYSRDGIKLLSITLNNILLPYFDLPLITHQVRELSALEVDKLVDRKSTIDGITIKFDDERLKPVDSKQTLVQHMGVVDEIVNYIKEGSLVVFVGSGLSTEMGYPTGAELAKTLANHFGLEYAGEDLSTIAERIIVKKGGNRGDLIRHIKKILIDSKKTESKSFNKLADLGVKVIFTTNWDTSIEDAFNSKSHNAEKIVKDEAIPLASENSTLVYKIHGDFDNPEKFVITDADVLDVEQSRPGIINALKDNLLRKHFLIIGYSMSDLDFKTIFHLITKYLGDLRLTSYATVLDGPEDKLLVLKSKGITPLKIRGDVLIGTIHEKLSSGK